MFNRTKKQTTSTQPEKPGGKGHPTPSRKQAQAAAKERARAGLDKKSSQKVLRERRSESNAKIRSGMKSGDPRYLMARDKGPVKAFVRDFIDVRISFMEWLLPLLVIIMVLQFSTVKTLMAFSRGLWSATILVVLVDTIWMMYRLGKEIGRRFPDEDTRGWRFYALMRGIQLRPLRMPKPRLKPRAPLPTKY